MTFPRYCYGCLRPVALRDNEPFRWFEITEDRPGEMQAVGAICEDFPRCVRDVPGMEERDAVDLPPMPLDADGQ